jgi:hypothetical protein
MACTPANIYTWEDPGPAGTLGEEAALGHIWRLQDPCAPKGDMSSRRDSTKVSGETRLTQATAPTFLTSPQCPQ